MLSEREALYLLNCLPGMYHRRLSRMLTLAGSFAKAYELPASAYYEAGIFQGDAAGRAFEGRREREVELRREYERLGAKGIRLILHTDEDYPGRLLRMPDPPYLLHVKGSLPTDDRPSAAIIGARACSSYGAELAAHFAERLAEAGVQIVSGLAYGIDLAAARGALKGSGESFGVLGSGVNICYPRESYPCFARMADGAGGVLSEFPPCAEPIGFHFVLRNRIIAGLADVLLVMEARKKSGTFITVDCALEQGKEVFALPGRITDELGQGCNQLIQDGASLLTKPEDVLEALAALPAARSLQGAAKTAKTEKMLPGAVGRKALPALASSEKIVYSKLDFNAKHVEAIARDAQLPLNSAFVQLTALERKGYAVSPQPAYYRKAFQ